MGQEQQVAPDLFNLGCLTANQGWGESMLEQHHDGGTTCANGVGVARANCAIGIGDADDWRFLADKGLDCVGALHLRHQVYHQSFYADDLCHELCHFACPELGNCAHDAAQFGEALEAANAGIAGVHCLADVIDDQMTMIGPHRNVCV